MPKAKKTPKKVDLEEVFDGIVERAILEAEGVECSKEEFLEGLRVMRVSLTDRMEQMESEIRSDEG